MSSIFVDGVEIEADTSDNLLQVLLQRGKDLPYFCWHPELGSVGACRQCAVLQYRDADDTRGRIVMACMTPVTDGALFGLQADAANSFRQSVIENLMLNHPHDCPVCEEGGECHLQDMTVMVGHRNRRYRGRKNTFRNQELGPFVGHEMNRCITCYRCTRYYQDYAGGTDLAAFASRDRVFFGRADDGPLESEFAGNLVEVCPTGVFTDKTLAEHYTRKWDLASAATVCVGCSLGCNTYTSERYGELRRVHNRFNYEVNGYFLCDRGRFGSGYVNGPARIPDIGKRGEDGRFVSTDANDALDWLMPHLDKPVVVGVGSGRASLEANFALQQLVGTENFCGGLGATEAHVAGLNLALLRSSLQMPTLREVENADFVLVVGEDLTNHAPRLALSVRQAAAGKRLDLAKGAGIPAWHDAAVRKLAQEARHPVFLVTPFTDRLDDIGIPVRRSPGDIVTLMSTLEQGLGNESAVEPGAPESELLAALKAARRPLIVCGASLDDSAVANAAVRLAGVLAAHTSEARCLCLPGAANATGVATMTARPGLDLLGGEGQIDTLVVLENDLARTMGKASWQKLRDRVQTVLVIDHIDTAAASGADLVLPASAPAESQGTWVNFEGRAQRSFAAFTPKAPVRSSAAWLLDILSRRSGEADESGAASEQQMTHIEDLTVACAAAHAELSGIVEAAPDRMWRNHGARVARLTPRSSGRTAMFADISVHEPRQPADDESAMAFTMEGINVAPASMRPYIWSPGWNSNQSIHKFQAEPGGPNVGGDPGVRLFDGVSGELAAPGDRPPRSGGQLVPRQEIFASEELSVLTPAVRKRAPDAYLSLTTTHAEALGVTTGDHVAWESSAASPAGGSARVVVDAGQAEGIVGYPAHHPQLDLDGEVSLTLRKTAGGVIASDGEA